MTKLNLGPSGAWRQDGWTNLDIANGYDLTKRKLVEYPSDSVELVYTSHCIEHLEFHEVAALVEAIRTVLKPGGVVRIVVPDADYLADVLVSKDIEFLVSHCPSYYGAQRHIPFSKHVESLIGWDHFRNPNDREVMHRSFFSWSILSSLLRFCGFRRVDRRSHCFSEIPEMCEEATLDAAGWTIAGFDNPLAAYMSLYVEATK